MFSFWFGRSVSSLDNKVYHAKQLYFLSSKYFINLQSVHRFLNNTNGSIYNSDYKLILRKAKGGDFVYLDPPYTNEYHFGYNQNQTISDDFESTLLRELQKLDNKGVKWLMTQADTPRVRERFNNYTIIQFKVYRGHSHMHSTELIIKNY